MPNPYALLYRLGMTPWERNDDLGPLPALLADLPPGRALDSGCGTGRHAVRLGELGWTVVGIDAVAQPLRAARARAAAADLDGRVTFVKADVTRLDRDVSGSFDLVLDVGCLHGLPATAQRAFATWVTAHTDAGAAMVVHAVRPRTGMGPHGLDEAGLGALFPTPWSVESVTESTTEVDSGPLRGAGVPVVRPASLTPPPLSASVEPDVAGGESFGAVGLFVDAVVVVAAEEDAVVEVGQPAEQPGVPVVGLAPGPGDVAALGPAGAGPGRSWPCAGPG